MTQGRRRAAMRRFFWPVVLAGGLLLVAFAQVDWGTSTEGVQPSISGLGVVSVPGAGAEDVDYVFADTTRRPGLATIVFGAIVVLAAGLGWWRRSLCWPALAIGGIASIGALATTIGVLADPSARLFNDRVHEALDLDVPTLQPGYGLIGTVVVAAVLVLCCIVGAVDSVIERRAFWRPGQPRAVRPPADQP